MAKDLTWWQAAILAVRGGRIRRVDWGVDPIKWITHITGLYLYHEEENALLESPAPADTVPHVVKAGEFTADDFTADDWTDEDLTEAPTTPPGGGGSNGGDPPGGPGPIVPPVDGGGSGGATGEPGAPIPPGGDPGGPGGPGAGSGGDGSGGSGIGPAPNPPGNGPGGGGDPGGGGGGGDPHTPHDSVTNTASWRSGEPICDHDSLTGNLTQLGGSAVFHCPEGTSWSITARYLGFIVSLGTKTVPLSLVGTGSRFDDERIGNVYAIGSPYSAMFVNTCPPFVLRATLLSTEGGVTVDQSVVEITL